MACDAQACGSNPAQGHAEGHAEGHGHARDARDARRSGAAWQLPGATCATSGQLAAAQVRCLPPPRYIEVITCGRVGRLENPFHFVASEPPRPGTAFASQAPLSRSWPSPEPQPP